MKLTVSILSLLLVLFSLPAQAEKKKGGGGEGPALRITECDAVSITVDIGKDGTNHETYKINDATKVTLDGAPGAARDLKAGMFAHIKAGADHVATSISATDPKAHPGKHRVG